MLVEYLPHQRWFSAKGQHLGASAIDITHRTVVAENYYDADVEQVLFTVGHADRAAPLPDLDRLDLAGAGPAGARRHRRRRRPDRLRRAVRRQRVPAAAGGDRPEPGLRRRAAGPPRAGRRDRHRRRGSGDRRRAVEHLDRLRAFGHPEGVPPAGAGPEPGRRDPPRAARRRLDAHRAADGRVRRAGRRRGDHPRPAHRVLRQQRGGLGDGDLQRAGPDERGRPARRRGRRRFRLRVVPAGRGGRRGARRPGPGVRHQHRPARRTGQDPGPDAGGGERGGRPGAVAGRTPRRRSWRPSTGRRTTRPASTCSGSTATCTSGRCCAR